MSAPVEIQTLTLEVGTTQFECQLTNGQLQPTYNDTQVTTYCGEFTSTRETFVLHLEGFQDWGTVGGLCDVLWEAVTDGDDLAFTLVVGGDSFAGTVAARRPPVGAPAGTPFDFTIDLPVQGTVARTPATP